MLYKQLIVKKSFQSKIIFCLLLFSILLFKSIEVQAGTINIDYGHLDNNSIIRDPTNLRLSQNPINEPSKFRIIYENGSYSEFDGSKQDFLNRVDNGIGKVFPDGWNIHRVNVNGGNGRFTVLYPHVGTYKGQDVGAKVTFDYGKADWGRRYTVDLSENFYYGYFLYARSSSLVEAGVTVTIVHAGTDQSIGRIDNSYLSVNSLNAYRNSYEWFGAFGKNIYMPSLNGITNLFYDSRHDGVGGKYDGPYNGYQIWWEDWVGGQNFAMSGGAIDFDNTNGNIAFGNYGQGTGWYQISSISIKPYIPLPSKEVHTNVGGHWDLASKNDPESRVYEGQQVAWIIKQKLPQLGEELLQPYRSIIIKDQIDNRFNVTNVTIDNCSPNDYTYNVDGNNNVTINFKSSLSSSYGKELVVHIDTVVKDGAEVGIAKNIAEVTIDGVRSNTNEVQVNISKYITPDPTKTITDTEGKNINNQDLKYNQDVYYNISQKVGRFGYEIFKRYNSWSIEDVVPKNIDVEEVYLTQGTTKYNNQDVGNFEITKTDSGTKVTFTANSDFLAKMSLIGETYTLKIKGKVNNTLIGINSDSHGYMVVNNKAISSINNDPKETNETTNKLYYVKYIENHVLRENNHLFETFTKTLVEGEPYEATPKNNHYIYEDVIARPVKEDEVITGVAGKNDINVNIYYYLPKLSINVDDVYIFTDKGSKGLPLRMNTSSKEDSVNNKYLKNVEFKYLIKDKATDKVVFSKTVKNSDFKSQVDGKLLADYLSKGKKNEYLVQVKLVNNPDKIKFETETNFNTFGYTSSEKVLTNEDVVDGNLEYEAPIATLKNRLNSKYKEFNEKIVLPDYQKVVKTKSGYGVDLSLSYQVGTTFDEENFKDMFDNKNFKVGTSLKEITFTAYPEEKLVDSYLDKEYPLSLGRYEFPMSHSGTLESPTDPDKEGNHLTYWTDKVNIPHVNVERKTGNLFTDNQVANNRGLIKYNVIDGGRKFYTPIWLKVGNYSIQLKSNEVGANYISLDLNKNIDIVAQMYATIDSETKDKDELLLEPVYPESENPKGWTQSELDWLKK